ncbi:iron-dicitrate ABC transporter ATP-binding protein [Lactiplantibacillus fabifermentans T30PCM01]|uniref:Iron-dicitrate ABC transporter ATP-binding protein n=1 Tax=Lactiplantibacillus fabifermentans T30PCM01 TaxID=1400520 RepID=W6T608_9LACO|nr:ABC transporter ATP-binding protein [Lactiplantibacillus fabifermentans]ETY73581.1 iron-dicitrate ABC transporter ATP-binding protein [Lactiplantibacillus fabifermentans T30PCM01]
MAKLIDARHIQVGYAQHPIINDLSITIPRGQITTLIGPNGSGKSTLIRAMAKLLKIDQGVLTFDDQNLTTLSHKMLAKKLAVLPQTTQAKPELTVAELVTFGRLPYRKPLSGLTALDREKIDWALTKAHLTTLKDRPLTNLSGGQRQRAWIAMAIAQDTDTIILDEPTTYLDLPHQLEVMQLIQELNQSADRTIIMALHDLNHAARFSDNLIAIKDGALAASGTVNDVMTAENLRRIFNIDATLIAYEGRPLILTYETATPAEDVQ